MHPIGVVRVVALHHPPSSRDLESLAGRDDFETALVDAEADIVLAGHTHVPKVQELFVGSGSRTRRIVEVVAGTATSHRTRGVERAWSHVAISSNAVSVTTHSQGADGWAPGPSTTLPLVAASNGRN